MGKNYFWIYVVISAIIFAVAVFAAPKAIRFLEKIMKKKDAPKRSSSAKKKHDYKTF